MFGKVMEGPKIPEGIRMLYDYIVTGVAGDELTKEIDTAVDRGRKNERWRGEYLKERQIILEEVRAERERADNAEERIKMLESMLDL